MTDELSTRLAELLDGTYDCVDWIVLNGYHSVCLFGWRLSAVRALMGGSEEQLDNAHLMRLAGRFSRRVRGFAKAHDIPVIDCRRGDRKHDIAEDYLAGHSVGRGLFMILVGRAVAPVWDVQRSSGGGIHLTKKLPYVNHYSFHIMDAQWGHITIKMAGHPLFGAQIILNGHEYVACQASKRHLTFTKEDNCFTQIADAAKTITSSNPSAEAALAARSMVGELNWWIHASTLWSNCCVSRSSTPSATNANQRRYREPAPVPRPRGQAPTPARRYGAVVSRTRRYAAAMNSTRPE